MTKRETIFAISGVVLLVAAFAGRSALRRATQVEWPESLSWFAGYAEPASKGPRVIIGHDSQYWRLKNVIRVDVRQGIPHTRDHDGRPIRDLVSYIDAEAAKTGAEYVVVSASREEKIGGVVAVIDECRKTRVRAIVLNEYLDAFPRGLTFLSARTQTVTSIVAQKRRWLERAESSAEQFSFSISSMRCESSHF